MKIIDLGCGKEKTSGAYGVDHHSFPGVDLVHDLNSHPYPIDENSFDKVIASHIVEHVHDVPALFDEIFRIAKPGAKVRIATPHFSNRSAYADPTHCHAFSVRFLDFFCGSKPRPMDFYHKATHKLLEHRFSFTPFHDPARFSLVSLRLSFSMVFRLMGIEALANAHPDFYEFYLAAIFPARDIFAEVEVIKEG